MNQTIEPKGKATLAGRIEAAGGGGLPQAAIDIAHEAESRRTAIHADTRISDAYRKEQLAAVDAEELQAMYDAQSREDAEAAQTFERRKAELQAQIKAQYTQSVRRDAVETASEQAERHHNSLRELTALAVEIETAKAVTDPDDLADTLDELLTAGRHDRVRRMGPVILARLRALSAESAEAPPALAALSAAAPAALARATSAYSRWKQANPTLSAQLRRLEEERQAASQNRARAYRQAHEAFKIGMAKHGMRIQG
jgi:hypothetical protein